MVMATHMAEVCSLLSSDLTAPECPLALPRRAPAASRDLSTTMERPRTPFSSSPSLSSTPTMQDLPTALRRVSVLTNTPILEMRMVLKRTPAVLSNTPSTTLALCSMPTMESPRMLLRRILIPSNTPTTRRTLRTSPTQSATTPMLRVRSTSRPRESTMITLTTTPCSVPTPEFRVIVRLRNGVSVLVTTARSTTTTTRCFSPGTELPPPLFSPIPTFLFFAGFACRHAARGKSHSPPQHS
ncbi:hypothetical protein F4801DRAFT_529650 [Xylaria longipes]|nr:hypothetical protein F4801DRAFT_529650 [Xylaria longipes]